MQTFGKIMKSIIHEYTIFNHSTNKGKFVPATLYESSICIINTKHNEDNISLIDHVDVIKLSSRVNSLSKITGHIEQGYNTTTLKDSLIFKK